MRAAQVDRLFARFRRTRDPAALAALFDATAPELLRVARYLAGDAHAAEDLVQSTFLVMLEDVHAHDGKRRVVPWLLGILANRARELRKARARAVDPARLTRPAPPDTASEAERAELEEALARALRALPSPYGEVLTLHLEHGLPAQAIAEALRRPAGTVRTQLVRGMELLRAALPAGFAAAACVAALPAGALARVRAAVLARAEVGVPAAGGATLGVLSGVLAMKKVSVAALMLVLAAALVLVAVEGPGGRAHDRPSRPPALASSTAPIAADEAASAEKDASAADPTRRQLAGVAGTTRGVLRLTLVWEDDASPAAGLEVQAFRRDERQRAENAKVRSDAHGIAAFDLAAGTWRVRCGATAQDFDVVAGETVDATLRVRAVVLEGVVVDMHGAAVPGAAIRHCPSYEYLTLTTSRADGRFAWRGAYANEVWAEKEGYAPSRVQYVTRDGTPSRHRFELGPPGVPVTGVVLGASGAPAAGALVALSVDDSPRGPLLPDGSHGRHPPPVLVRADEAGRFATRSVPPGEHALAASAPGEAPVLTFVEVVPPPPSGPAAPLVVRLGGGGSVRGVVRDVAGEPIAGAAVSAGFGEIVPGLWPYHRNVLDVGARTTADEQGRYELRLLPPGKLWVSARRAGFGEARDVVHVRAEGAHTWDPMLAPIAVVGGTVLDPEDRPVAGFEVRLQVGPQMLQAPTDAQGRFVIEGVPASGASPGAWGDSIVLLAGPAGLTGAAARVPWTRQVHARAGDRDVVLRTSVALRDSGFLSGRVVDARDAAIHAATIHLYAQPFSFDTDGVEKVEDRDGRFRIGPLPPGSYDLRLEAPQHDEVAVEVELAAGETRDLGAVRLEARGTLTVVVRTSEGAKVDDAVLRVGDGSRWLDDRFTKVAAGAWRSAALWGGLDRVEVWGATCGRIVQRFEVRPGTDAPLEVIVEPGTPVHFVMEQPEPRQARWTEHARLTLRGPDGTVVETTFQIDGRETYTWTRGFAPGTYAYDLSLLRGTPELQATGTFTVPADARGDVRVDVGFR